MSEFLNKVCNFAKRNFGIQDPSEILPQMYKADDETIINAIGAEMKAMQWPKNNPLIESSKEAEE